MNALQFQKKLLSMQENMMNFALMLTANRDDAQDLMQDTTLKVLDNQEKFVDNINFKGWVLTVMRNIFINNYHKIVRTQTVVCLLYTSRTCRTRYGRNVCSRASAYSATLWWARKITRPCKMTWSSCVSARRADVFVTHA